LPIDEKRAKQVFADLFCPEKLKKKKVKLMLDKFKIM